ncbi:MAG: Gfo/Idh/MocA family oxidoreductase [Oligoflexus sp.]|nr:Gfo/Idh/MocA family oxidoreductase [Pseudopedobacter sp.]
MERRGFIKNTGLLAGGIMVQNKVVQAFSINKQILNVGVIGCGDRGKGLISVMDGLSDFYNVIAICDVLDFRIKETIAKNKREFILYTDYRKLLENNKIDAVIISVTLSDHFEIAKAALLAGKHIYLEKTMTYNIPQALELSNLKLKHPHQILQIGHQYRYVPLYFKVKDMIEKGYLGKVTQIDCRWDRNSTWRRPITDKSLEKAVNWRMYKEYSGGLVAELLSHQIDFINWAFDTHPDEILATGGIDYYKDGRETYDNVQVMLRYNKEGIVGNFGSTLANAHDGYLFKIKGTKGMVSLLMNEGIYYPEKKQEKELKTIDGVTGATKIEWNKEGGIKIDADNSKDGTWYALKDFYDCIIYKKEPTSNIKTGSNTAFCVHLANQSMYNHKIEYWKDYF